VDLSGEWGVPFEVVVADSGYGKYPLFLEGLEDRKLPYVCGVESTFGVRLPEEVVAAKEAGAPQYRGRGQPPKERPAPLYTAEEVIGSLPDEAWQTVSWREGTKGALGKRMPAEGEDLPDEEEQKYYYSSLEAGVSLERLAALAKSRWAIEQFYEDAKGECGLGDYQGRRWDGLHRHLGLVMVAYSFLMIHSSVLAKDPPHEEEEEAFSPRFSGQAHDAASDSPAGIDVVAGGSGALVHRNRKDKNLPSS
jgi:SRSO17 transposase